jgi:hypothetical protein
MLLLETQGMREVWTLIITPMPELAHITPPGTIPAIILTQAAFTSAACMPAPISAKVE